MHFQFASLALLGLATAVPTYPTNPAPSKGYNPFPLKDGFPNPSPDAIKQIQKLAGGTLPNGPLPPNPNSPVAALDLQVIAFNEIFEVAYFTQLLQNVTENKPGYQVTGDYGKGGKDYIVKTLKEVIAQEELHALLANTALKAYGGKPVEPAAYKFPVSDLKGALDFAGLFTSLVLGALQSVQVDLTNVKAPALVQVVGSIIGQEGEQTGFYRASNGRVPSASPFLTVAAGQFAYNALQQTVVVPGSNKNDIKIPVYDALTVKSKAEPKDCTLKFEVKSKTPVTTSSYITYVSGQNIPVTKPIRNIKQTSAGTYSFEADFPFVSAGFSNGLTIGALTKNMGPFADVAAVAGATTAGPGLIYIN